MKQLSFIKRSNDSRQYQPDRQTSQISQTRYLLGIIGGVDDNHFQPEVLRHA
jgi:hypothetical protein